MIDELAMDNLALYPGSCFYCLVIPFFPCMVPAMPTGWVLLLTTTTWEKKVARDLSVVFWSMRLIAWLLEDA